MPAADAVAAEEEGVAAAAAEAAQAGAFPAAAVVGQAEVMAAAPGRALPTTEARR